MGRFLKTLALFAAILATAAAISQPSRAQQRPLNYIRDTEIENTIRVYVAPLFEAASLDPRSVRITLIQDDRLNAFVSGGQNVFINTGLLISADDPEQVMGVIAHELGHITGGHIARFEQNLKSANMQSIAAMVLGVPIALATGRADAAAAAMALGAQIGQRSLLQYSREMEQSADQAAITFLADAGLSPKGLDQFMEKLHAQDRLYSAGANPYTRTHPLTEDRIKFLENAVKQSPIKHDRISPALISMHARMQAKLIGYLYGESDTLSRYPLSDTSDPAVYARAIAYMRSNKTDKALEEIHLLLKRNPGDPFYLEAEGDILRNAGKLREALVPYRASIEKLPWAALIRTSLAQVIIEINDDSLQDEALENLKQALRYEPWMTRSWRLLATIYGRKGDFGQAYLAQAEEAIRQGAKGEAAGYSKKAMEILPKDSPSWVRAQDISVQATKPDGQ